MDYCYLLHFEQPLKYSQPWNGDSRHYIGTTSNLELRLQQHKFGSGLVSKNAKLENVKFEVGNLWKGGEDLERMIHKSLGRTYCKTCNGKRPLFRHLEINWPKAENHRKIEEQDES